FGDEQLRHLVGESVRTVMRRTTAVLQARSPLRFEAREPLVADASTHTVTRAELAHREAIAQRIPDKRLTFFHRSTLLPWHRSPRHSRGLRCRLECYRCSRTAVLPMYPG